MNSPLVTAVIPTYRRAKMVRRAVETVLAQDYPALEVIVVDDNTEPAEQQAVRDALAGLGENVIVIPNARSKGACGARCRASRISTCGCAVCRSAISATSTTRS
jgi:glycosyltransferase involved in cell wall biosynthesis